MTKIWLLLLLAMASPTLAAPLADTDGDGVPDTSDCAPNAPGVSAPPQEIGSSLRVDKSATDGTIARLHWTRSVQGDASSLYRGSIVPGQPRMAPSCFQAQVAALDASDVQVPAVGQGFYYLVSALNTCGESRAGLASNGTPTIPSPACPTSTSRDTDQDTIPDLQDNCPLQPNTTLADGDHDFVGTACDLCPTVADPPQSDSDEDGIGNACEAVTRRIPILVQDIRSDHPDWAQHRQQSVTRIGARSGQVYRSLGKIDLSTLPAGAVIDDVQLVYWITSGDPANEPVSNGDTASAGANVTVELRKMLRRWNDDEPFTYSESYTDNDTPAVSGQTAWGYVLYPQAWEAGGATGLSDSAPVSVVGVLTSRLDTRFALSSPELLALVRSWQTTPSTNLGFLLKTADSQETASLNWKILCGKGFPLETSTGLDAATAIAHRPAAFVTYHVP